MGRHYSIDQWPLFVLEGFVDSEIQNLDADVMVSDVMDALTSAEEEALIKAGAAFSSKVVSAIPAKLKRQLRGASEDDVGYGVYSEMVGEGVSPLTDDFGVSEEDVQAIVRAFIAKKTGALPKLEEKMMTLANKAVKRAAKMAKARSRRRR